MSSNLPLVSIIVTNWNGEKYIGKCLNSLLSQSYPNCEIIVVDNGSSDGSLKILRGYGSRIRLIANKENLGFAAGNNVGIRTAQGEALVIYNNDAIANREWLSTLVRGLKEPPEADIVSGIIYYHQSDDVIWSDVGRIDLITGLCWHAGQYRKENQLRLEIDYFPGCALMIKKAVFDRIGLLDERFFLYAEDPDFCLRAKQAGFKLKLVPGARVWHMVSMSAVSAPWSQKVKLRSEYQLILKLWPRWCLPLTLGLRLTAIPLSEIVLCRQLPGYLLLNWRAFFSALKNKPGKLDSDCQERLRNLPLRNHLFEAFQLLGQRMRRRN